MDPEEPLRIVVVGPDPFARGGLVALLGADPRLELLASLAPEELAPSAPARDADLVILDAAGLLDLDVVGALPEVPVLALVVHADAARDLRDAGAQGVVSREAGAQGLVEAALAVVGGMVVLAEPFAEALLRPRRPVVEGELLTAREVEVLELLAEGFSNKEIGAQLGISPHTAKFHVQSLLDKLDAVTRTEAVVRALRLGFLRL